MVPGDGRMRYRMPKKISTRSEQGFRTHYEVSVLIGPNAVALHRVREVKDDKPIDEVYPTVYLNLLAARRDIDPIAFRQAVLDLYANFPSNR